MAPKTIQSLAETLPRREFADIIGAQRPAAAMIAHRHRKMSLEAISRLAGGYLIPKMGKRKAADFVLRSLEEWFPEAFVAADGDVEHRSPQRAA